MLSNKSIYEKIILEISLNRKNAFHAILMGAFFLFCLNRMFSINQNLWILEVPLNTFHCFYSNFVFKNQNLALAVNNGPISLTQFFIETFASNFRFPIKKSSV